MEQEAVERLRRLGVGDRVTPDLVAVPAELVPDMLDGLEARPLVARVHEVAHPEREVLEVLALRDLHVGDGPAEGEVPEVHVAPLVLQHVVEELAQGRVARLLAHEVEGCDREALDDHLHAEEFQLPEVRREDLVEDGLQQRVHRVDLVEPLDVALEDLHVPALVHDLRGGVELGVELGDAVDELAADDERALLAVEELREAPGGDADLDLPLLLRREPAEEVGAGEGDLDVQDRSFLADGPAPVDGRRAVPLVLLRGLVERLELFVRRLVVVVPQRLELVGHPRRGFRVGRRHAHHPALNVGSVGAF